MKRIVSLLCLIALCLSLFACGEEDYPPVESTEREAEVLMRFEAGGKTYRVRYELYRAFYLTYRAEYPEQMSAEESRMLQGRVLSRIYAMYAAFALCEKYGIDLYSKKMDEKIEDFVRISVEGGYIDSTAIEGYGSYDEYLKALRALYLNYEVQTLILRYNLAMNAIEEHYREVGGVQENVTRQEVRAFYDQESTRRYLSLYLSADIFTEERATEIRDSIAALSSEGEVGVKMIQYSALAADEILSGQVITPYNLDTVLYADLTKAAVALAPGEASAPIPIYNNQNRGYFILWAAEKSDAHFDESFESISREYLNDKIGRELDALTRELSESIRYTDAYENLDRDAISMND